MVLHGLKDRGVNGETDAVVFYDLATDVLPVFSRCFSQVYGSGTQNRSVILGPSQRVSRGYSPNGLGARHVYTWNAKDK